MKGGSTVLKLLPSKGKGSPLLSDLQKFYPNLRTNSNERLRQIIFIFNLGALLTSCRGKIAGETL